jgi:hypothetical protein
VDVYTTSGLNIFNRNFSENILFIGFAFTPFNIILGATAPWWLIIPLDAAFTSGIVWLLDQVETALQK